MRPIDDIFGKNAHDFDQDDDHGQAEMNIFDGGQQSMIEIAMENIDTTDGLGDGYARKNPELLAGIIQAMLQDHNARHLVNTLQVGCAALLEAMQKNHDAILEEMRAIRKAIESREVRGNE